MLNRVQEFIDKRDITRYRFWQDTGLGRDTAYRLCNDPTYIPTGNVLEKICSAYQIQPGELLFWKPDEDLDNQKIPDPAPPPLENVKTTKRKTKEKVSKLANLYVALGGGTAA